MEFQEIDKDKVKKQSEDFLKKVGKIVEEKRKEKNMTQDCLAFNCLTDKSFINKIEKGVYANVTIYTLIKLASALGHHVNIFF